MNKILGYTKVCVICGEKISLWTGHVNKGKYYVIAGFCETHRNYPNEKNTACFGEWKEQDGIEQHGND